MADAELPVHFFRRRAATPNACSRLLLLKPVAARAGLGTSSARPLQSCSGWLAACSSPPSPAPSPGWR